MTTDFGRDVSCTDTMRTGRLVSGPRLVAEACYRRLITPRGTLLGGEDEANYGLDLGGLLGSSTSAAEVAALPGRIRNELLKDERVESVEALVTATTTAGSTSYVIDVTGTTAEGPFELKLAVADVTLAVLKIGPEV